MYHKLQGFLLDFFDTKSGFHRLKGRAYLSAHIEQPIGTPSL